MNDDGETYALPLDGPLGNALRLALVYGEAEIEQFRVGTIDGDALVIDLNGDDHFCDVCGQLYAEPLGVLEVPFGLSEDDPRVVRVVLGVCDNCKAGLISQGQAVES